MWHIFLFPRQNYKHKTLHDQFVSDTSGRTNDFLLPEPAPLTHYANLAIHDAQWWNDTLQLSGGALEDSKCSYHFMYNEFTRNGHPVLKGGTFEPVISIRFNNSTTPTPLKQLSMYTSHKTLGMYKNPDGNSTTAFRVVKEKNATHTKTASHSPLTHTDACLLPCNLSSKYRVSLPLRQSSMQPMPTSSETSQTSHTSKMRLQSQHPKCNSLWLF